jgi:hypothetical protein
MFDESVLIQKLRRVHQRYAATTSESPVVAVQRKEDLAEFQATISDEWAQTLFAALCEHYGLKPYRRRGQRATTAMVDAPKTFMERTFWPEFHALQDELRKALNELAERAVGKAINVATTER